MAKNSTLWGVLAGIFCVLLWVLSIPPFDFAEAAYIAFCPLLLWLYLRPRGVLVLLVGFLTGWVGWFTILIWLRHVTWVGTSVLSAILSLLFVLWLLFAARIILSVEKRSFPARLLGFAGIAGLWVFIEWTRTWFLWGFPWAPIALSQWERPVVLQLAAWTGAYGVSFLLIFFNCCVAHTLRSRVVQRERKFWSGWFSPDLYMAMGSLGLCMYVFFQSLPLRDSVMPMFSASLVQPYIKPELKWDTERELENLNILETQTRFVSSAQSDFILWPEASTPWPILGDYRMQRRIERLVNEIDAPILMGNLSVERGDENVWRNGIFLVEPKLGLSSQSYAKRELVPFGEYVPPPFGFISKVVPFEGSFTPGTSTGLIDLKVREETWRVGPLVCYEDVFPDLARASARDGAQVFFVATNNAWYGEEGGAEQHAAHAVLRAVENRRPIIRVGNGGWSGWIDAYGTIREILLDENGSIYFRGGGAIQVTHYEEWRRRQSFYTRNGDWFVVVVSGLALLAGFSSWRQRQTLPSCSEG